MPMDSFLPMLCAHLDAVLDTGLARLGPDPCAMWMSALDVHTCRYPEDDTRDAGIGKRVYRYIDAPKGSSLYWDQPLVVTAQALSALTGAAAYAEAADAYVRAFLERSVAANGIFLWGNHYYWDAWLGRTVGFRGSEEPAPCDPAAERARYHETRPLPPAWESFWRVDREATARCIRALGSEHLFDPACGGFNRHADRGRGCAFLEAGGILCESLAWLYAQTREAPLLETVRRVAGFSFGERGASTGLLRNNPTGDNHEPPRWDFGTCTTEVGLWAGSLLRAAAMTGETSLTRMARDAVAAYLERGYDEASGQYYGCLAVEDGAPVLGAADTPYRPGDHAGLWRVLFPTHDYPFQFAETCVRLWQETGEARFREGVERWAAWVMREIPANQGRGAYAENYGRAIHFLAAAGESLARPEWLAAARALADEALAVLHVGPLFRTHPGEDRCDAVDGPGILFLALLRLETGSEPELLGFGF